MILCITVSSDRKQEILSVSFSFDCEKDSGTFAVFRRAMTCQYHLLFLFLCGFAALSVSTTTCGPTLLVGTSCIIKLPVKNNDKSNDIKWSHSSSNAVIEWKRSKPKSNTPGLTVGEDGSLKFQSVRLNNTGEYTYTVFSSDGIEINKGKEEIKVYEKAPKPTVKISCTPDGNATLTCDIGNTKDLTLSWYKDNKPIQNEKNPQVLLSSTQVQENKPYSCEASNPVSKDKSENTAVPCSGRGLGLGKLFGIDIDWIMLSIIAGGGALLLVLICVLIICACRSCRQRKKHKLDEEEFRLSELTPGHNGTSRSKQTARGQPAPPIPDEDSMPCSPSPQIPPRNQTQPKAQSRARPPPPPEDDDEEYPPPLPQPRKKQHRTKRNQEPYRPME